MQRMVILLPTPESCLARYRDRIPGFPSPRIGDELSAPGTQPGCCARGTMPGDGFVTSGQWKNAAVLAVAIDAPRWAWLPPGIRDTFDPAAAAGVDADVRFAFGDPAKGAAGFRLTHRQALAAQAVALATGSHAPRAVAFGEVAPVAMMLGSAELLRAWMLGTLAGLASDDEHHARLRETLLAFLQTGGSYKTTAEQSVMIAIRGNGCTDRNPAGPGPGSATPPAARAGQSRRGCPQRSSSGRTSAAGYDARRTATPGRWGAGPRRKPGRRNGHSGPWR